MILLLLLLEFCLATAAAGFFLYVSSKLQREFLDWLILVLVFFAILKLATIFMVFYESPSMGEVVATLDLGFATAFTTFVFLRCREVELI